ncbi:reverse transcriptase family protein [Microscilla marina]|uniref:Uncharacterized protein n=1 Tax=Microscilla marina ATCC 23134 TaxID=313606 RepID=A1ZN06_MICM2|nr:hypothetical protein [Microscilla marina]EAY28187.1 hypothetical protein M23134_03448 [Microscilla marina ATCC 23134]
MQDLNSLPAPDKTSKQWHKRLQAWFVITAEMANEKPWQALFITTRKLRGIVMVLIALAAIGTGITLFIFLFPWKLTNWLPVLQVFLGLFFIALLLFIYFREQGNRFHARFLEEVRQLVNEQQHTFIPLDKRRILRQFEWYSKTAILKCNLIALCLALIFSTAPKKVINALILRKQSLVKSMQTAIEQKRQRIAHLNALNAQSEQMVVQAERLIKHNQIYIKRLRKGMQKHYRQITELRRYLRHLNQVDYQIRQLQKIGHNEIWKQERVVKSNGLVMGHIKGLVQAKLEQKEKPVALADAMLSKHGAILEKFKQLRVRYRKLERRTNHFSYLNSLEVKKAQVQIIKNKQLVKELKNNIKQRDNVVKSFQYSLAQAEQKFPRLKTLEAASQHLQ